MDENKKEGKVRGDKLVFIVEVKLIGVLKKTIWFCNFFLFLLFPLRIVKHSQNYFGSF